ncbi:MAG: hypothetical protein ABEJ82_09425 [Haloplanus sp.]
MGEHRRTRVRAWSRREFDAGDFDPSADEFKDAIVVPQAVFDRLYPGGDAATGYAWASATGGDAPAKLLTVLTFSDAYAQSSSPPKAFLRLNKQEELGLDGGEEVTLTPVDAGESGPLRVVRYSTRTESTRTDECRTHPSVLDRMGVEDGDLVELYNPTTGGRILLDVVATPDMAPDTVSLSTRARKLLGAEFEARADEHTTTVLHARRPVRRELLDAPKAGRLRRLRNRLLDASVGYHEANLRVDLGLNVDENRATARMNPDTMEVLGVDDGDRVILSSQTDRTRVRVHYIRPDSHYIETDSDFEPEDVRGRTVLLPATGREAADVLCHDVVRVRRDTGYVAAKRIVPSLFGFLGVFIGGLQTIDLVFPPAWKLPAVGLTLLLSLSAIWFVLWPERQRCQ